MMPTPEEYISRFNKATIKPTWLVAATGIANTIVKNRARYEKVEKATGVPWQLIGCLHSLESSLNFTTWLANGDPLTGPTVQVPAGLRLPGNPPWDWSEAAIKSLVFDGFDKRSFVTLADWLLSAELFNGTGYITGSGRNTTPPSTSPYLWSGTTEYMKGKYVSDGRFDPSAVSSQVGVVAILKAMGMDTPPDPNKKVTWFELFRKDMMNIIVGYAGDKPITTCETTSIKFMQEFMNKHEGANSFMVAPAGKAVPSLIVDPTPAPKHVPIFRLTKDKGETRSDGMVQLNLQVVNDRGEVAGIFKVVSGLPDAQVFRKGDSSVRGSMEPLPEGKYAVGLIEWADVRDNYDASWGTGIGAAWMSLTPQFPTMRAAIGIHIDYNVLGTLGCVGFPSVKEFKRFVTLIRQPENDGQFLFADWGLGSCPPADGSTLV